MIIISKLIGSGFSTASGRRLQFDRRGNVYVSVKNSKSQIPNNKQITMTKIQNYKLFGSLDIEIWDFIEIWCLKFEI